MNAEDLMPALSGNAEPNETVNVITQALELAIGEADAIMQLGDGTTEDLRGVLAHGLRGRLQALRSFVSSTVRVEIRGAS